MPRLEGPAKAPARRLPPAVPCKEEWAGVVIVMRILNSLRGGTPSASQAVYVSWIEPARDQWFQIGMQHVICSASEPGKRENVRRLTSQLVMTACDLKLACDAALTSLEAGATSGVSPDSSSGKASLAAGPLTSSSSPSSQISHASLASVRGKLTPGVAQARRTLSMSTWLNNRQDNGYPWKKFFDHM